MKILERIAEIKLGIYDNTHIDPLGNAYEFFMNRYASNAGKPDGKVVLCSPRN